MKKRFFTGLVLLLLLFMAACNGVSPGSGVYVWIDVPVDGLTLPSVQPIQIEGHASAFGGIQRVEILINDAPFITLSDFPSEEKLVPFQSSWNPSEPGKYVIRVTAYNTAGTASDTDTSVILIRGDSIPAVEEPTLDVTVSVTPTLDITVTLTPTPTNTSTPTVTPTATKTLPPAAAIQFWADPASVDAGKCTNLKWSVTNASKVIFGGISQPMSGADEECPCENKNYTLTVTDLYGKELQRTTSVTVNGICDSAPPPAPELVVPANGLSIGCKSSQSLSWLPVSDPSGISEYRVEVQVSPDNSSWSAASGSPFTGLTDKTLNLSVSCGYYYRWRVMAVDGKGNTGAWSGWSTFSILLG